MHADNTKISGWLWSDTVGWINAHCSNTDSCAQVDFGLSLKINEDKPGWMYIIGHAWSENAGWIVSHCLATDLCGENEYGLQLEIATGMVQGYAWSENLGWLSFSCANTSSCAAVNFGLQFNPAVSGEELIFKDSFESVL